MPVTAALLADESTADEVVNFLDNTVAGSAIVLAHHSFRRPDRPLDLAPVRQANDRDLDQVGGDALPGQRQGLTARTTRWPSSATALAPHAVSGIVASTGTFIIVAVAVLVCPELGRLGRRSAAWPVQASPVSRSASVRRPSFATSCPASS